jgi:hypothetical protein
MNQSFLPGGLPSGSIHYWFISSIPAIVVIYSLLNLIMGVSGFLLHKEHYLRT